MKRGDVITVSITDYAFGGKGIAKVETENGEYVIFVENAFPGQTVEARIAKKRKRYAEAKLIEIIKRSEVEKPIDFQEISGGPYIFVPVNIQEKYKKDSALEVFRRIGGIANPNDYFDEFISSPNHYHYRNKMEYSFSSIEHDIHTGEEKDEAFALGFKRRGTWWKVENLDKLKVYLQSEESAVRYWGASGLLILGKKAEPAIEELKVATLDKSANVVSVAAEALYNLGEKEIAFLERMFGIIRSAADDYADELGMS